MAPPLITSIHNPRVKRAARLRDRRGRKQQNRMLVDGLREIQRACTAGIETEELYVCESMLDAMTRRVLCPVLNWGFRASHWLRWPWLDRTGSCFRVVTVR
jgi:hypothetical protein